MNTLGQKDGQELRRQYADQRSHIHSWAEKSIALTEETLP